MQGGTPGTYNAESLPNITGVLDCYFLSGHYLGFNGVFSDTIFTNTVQGMISNPNWNIASGGGEKYTKIDFKAVNSSSTYQDGAKVQPSNIEVSYIIKY